MRLDNKLFASIYYQFLSFLNHYSISYLVVLFFIINKTQTVSEIFLILSFSLIITQGFSANLRNIYLGSKQFLDLKKIVLLRLIIAVPGFILTNFFIIFFIEEKFLI